MSPWITLAVAGLAVTAGCQSTESGQPAVLTDFGPSTQNKVMEVIRADLGRATISFGAGDPTTVSQIIVLPPRPGAYETNSTALPITYDIRMGTKGCYLMRDQGTAPLPLPDGICQPKD